MNIVFIFLIIIIVVIIVLIVLHKSKIFKSPDAPTQKKTSGSYSQSQKINQYAPQPTWGQPEANPAGSGSGLCTIYTFIGGQYTPAAPAYSILNSGRGFYVDKNLNNEPLVCLDSDQLFAYSYKHTCQNPEGSSAGAGCILTVDTFVPGIGVTGPGNFVPVNTVEGNYQDGLSSKLYGPCVPANIGNNYDNSLYCQGNIGLIIPNFKPQPNYNSTGPTGNMCMNGLYGNTGGVSSIGNIGFFNLNTVSCDLSDPGQIFRMTRYIVDSDGTLTQDDNGNVASIVHRYTGYYLAPNLIVDTATVKDSAGNIDATYYYDFTSVIYNYGSWTDNSGNTGFVSSDLILIPPSADLSRKGVYWLLQNQTFSAQFDSTATDIDAYRDVGILINQTNYTARFPNGPAEPSYYAQQTFNNYTGPSGDLPSSLFASGPQSSCYFGTASINPKIVPNIPSNIAPQQIVYVPDLRLLPSIVNADPSRMWSYLVNNLSINVKNDGTPFLTPYRTNINVDVGYRCFDDPVDSNNKFTVLTGVVNSTTNPPSDTQFINYNLYTSQIQMGVTSGFIAGSTGTSTGNSNYASNSNPFIPR
jgi:hypothetical protein